MILPEGLLDFIKVTFAELKDNSYYNYQEELNIHPEDLKDAKLGGSYILGNKLNPTENAGEYLRIFLKSCPNLKHYV